MMNDNEKFWVGPADPENHAVMHMQCSDVERNCSMTPDGTCLQTDYSEYSVRLYDPNIPSLSFIHRTLAILPKSRLRSIYNLIGDYLETYDARV